jgi:hypothetical protein
VPAKAPHGDPGGSHCSPASIVPLPQRIVVEVVDEVDEVVDVDVDVVLELEVDEDVDEDVLVVVVGGSAPEMESRQLCTSVWSVPDWPHEPALVSADDSLPSAFAWQAPRLPGLVISFAVQASSEPAALPAAFAEAEGHLPSPGTSAARVVTQLSTNDSIADVVPGHAAPAFAMADENFASALLKHAESTAWLFALAFE